MPNGGSDNCGNCFYNKAQSEIGRAFDRCTDHEQFVKASLCTIRNTNIPDPFYTYCRNFYPQGRGGQPKHPTAVGAIHALGLNHQRIPWNGVYPPMLVDNIKCAVCGASSHSGIRVETVHGRFETFCSNEHYVGWLFRPKNNGSLPDSE